MIHVRAATTTPLRSPRRSRRTPLLGGLLLVLLASAGASGQASPILQHARDRMVDEEIVAAGVENPRVIASMRRTPRHEFVPPAQRKFAYLDMALPIGSGQTISPPFVVALMTEALDPRPNDRVLEIGTGSGYQAAVLSPLVDEVYSIEIVPELGREAARTLRRLDYENVHTRVGDGFKGWPEHAPFDKIIVTCSPENVPRPLVEQLRDGGRMVIPVGQRYQQTLYVLRKEEGQLKREPLRPTLFVPMTGQAEERRRVRPDPTRPEIVNGGFEQALGEEPGSHSGPLPEEQGTNARPLAAGWHYQRQAELIADEDAPEGRRYIRFHNADPGRGCRALQAFAVDGREVRAIDVALAVRGDDLRPGQDRLQQAALIVTFYDERRAMVGHGIVGPWRASFDWQPERKRLAVPSSAREAIIRIGLHGGLGTLEIDGLSIAAAR